MSPSFRYLPANMWLLSVQLGKLCSSHTELLLLEVLNTKEEEKKKK